MLSDGVSENTGRSDGNPLLGDDPRVVEHVSTDPAADEQDREIQADLASIRQATGYSLRPNRRQPGESWRYQDRRADEKREEYSLHIGLRKALKSMPRDDESGPQEESHFETAEESYQVVIISKDEV